MTLVDLSNRLFQRTPIGCFSAACRTAVRTILLRKAGGDKSPMKRHLGLLAGVCAIIVATGPTLACTIPLPKMTPKDVDNAQVAFVGTVKSIGERSVEILDNWPRLMACQRMVFDGEPLCPADQPVSVAVFKVEEPIRGVETGQEFVVPQGQGSDCATPYRVDRRYLFGSTGINGQVWIVEDGMTASQAMAGWQTLPEYFDEGRRYKPGEEPWRAFSENPETSLADETYLGIDGRVLAELIGLLRWEQESPDGLKVSALKLTWFNRRTSEYVPLTDRSSLDWRNLDAWPGLMICGKFELAKNGHASQQLAFAYTPGSPLTFSQGADVDGGGSSASADLRATLIDGLLETWGCLDGK